MISLILTTLDSDFRRNDVVAWFYTTHLPRRASQAWRVLSAIIV